MAISLASIKTGTDNKPPRILIFGPHGVGKSTFGADAPNPIFLPTEDGLGMLDTARFPVAKSFDEVMQALTSLATEDHNYQTLVEDSLDWLEPLIWQRVCADNNVNSIESIPYGKGFLFALTYWRDYLDAINYLRDERGMMIIQTAHTEVKRFESPDSDAYDRYIIKLHKGASALVQEHSDCIFFVNYKVAVTQEDVGFNQKRKRAVGSGHRVIYTQEKPAFVSKNRFALPESIPFDEKTWAILANNIPWLSKLCETANIEQPQAKEVVQQHTQQGE